METNNIYFYYNKNGQLISRTPYYENGSIRQGSTFILNLLFEKDFVNSGDTIMLYFKWPQKVDLNELPYVSFYDDYSFEDKGDLTFTHIGLKTFDKDLSKFGILKNVKYDCWSFFNIPLANKDSFPNLTELDGNLEFTPKIINQNGEINVLATSRIFVEKDVTYKSNLKVSSHDLDAFLSDISIQFKSNFIDGHSIIAFKVAEDGNLYMIDGRVEEEQKTFKYKIDDDGFLCIEYPEN